MTGPVAWQPDGSPRSNRFDDVYRSAGQDGLGGLAQARHVFLGGCGLLGDAPAWAGVPQWHVLENGFGLGLNCLATAQAWLQWQQAWASTEAGVVAKAPPPRLFYSATEAWPCAATDIARSAQPFPELHSLADELQQQWRDIGPGVHRLLLAGGTVHLTLHIGPAVSMLREMDALVDSVYLDGFNPDKNPEMWNEDTLHAVARLCRPGTRLSTWCVASAVRQRLAAVGFECHRAEGLPPKRHRLQAHYAPRHWRPLRGAQTPADRRALVIGAGLAGSSVAYSLSRRGWQVQVLDIGPGPAAGASGLPAGVLAPHVSPDDSPLSRLTRAGIRQTLQRAEALLRSGLDHARTGVLEHRPGGARRLPQTGPDDGSRPARPEELQAAGLAADASALWHPEGGWVRPVRLVAAQLSQPGVTLRAGAAVRGLRRDSGDTEWQALDERGAVLGQAPLLVLAAGPATADLLAAAGLVPQTLPLHPLRGQIAWGRLADLPATVRARLPHFPVNGHGSWLAGPPVPATSIEARTGHDQAPPDEPGWFLGSSFVRGDTGCDTRPSEQASLAADLPSLLPGLGEAVAPQVLAGQAWAGVRCTLPDRVPALGAVADSASSLLVATGMGARGLSFAVLAGEVLAADLHGEPWPAETRLVRRLMATRFGLRHPAARSAD